MRRFIGLLVAIVAMSGCVEDNPFVVEGPFRIELANYTLEVLDDGSGYFNHTLIFTNGDDRTFRVRAILNPEMMNDDDDVDGRRSARVETENRRLVAPSREFPSGASWEFNIVSRFDVNAFGSAGRVLHEVFVTTIIGDRGQAWIYHYPCIDQGGEMRVGVGFCGVWQSAGGQPPDSIDKLDPPSMRPRP